MTKVIKYTRAGADGGASYVETVDLPDPPATVPASVIMAQARIALKQAGLFDSVEAAIAAVPAAEKMVAEEAWQYSPTLSRTGVLVNSLRDKLKLSDAQIDALFIAAGLIDL